MTTEHPQREKANHGDSPGQMRGWFKLIETIRQTDPPLTSIESPSPPTLTMETNGHRSIALESLPSQSPTDLPSPLALSTPSPPPAPIEPTPTRAATKRSSTRPKRITIRKSTRSKEVNPSKTDSVLPDRPPAKRLSHDHSSNGSIIPFATDLYNLPGHHHRQDDSRDDRFLHYFDMNSLSMHLNACLYIEKRSSFSFTKQHIFKTRHNILSKIFKLDYIKTLQRHVNADEDLFADGTEGSEPRTASSTALSFQTDWSINRRSSSVSRHARKNFFHDLQLNPKRQLFATTEEDHRTSEGQQRIDVECIKDILLRTYYPHLHNTIAFGDSFGAKAKLLNKHEAFSNDEGMTKMLKCPLVTAQSPSITLSPRGRGRKRKHQDVIEKPAPIITMPRRVSEEIPPVPINESVLVSTPSKPLNHRHKRSVANNNDNLKKSKRKRFVSPPSPAQRTMSPSESGDEILPDELPRPTLIKNGLRSNYYKTNSEIDGTSSSRLARKRSHPSASLPPFYTGIFESDQDTSSHLDYQLPYDIFWFSQKQSTAARPKKRKLRSTQSKEQPAYEEISENLYSDASIRESLLASNTDDQSPACGCQSSGTCDDGLCTKQRIRRQQWFDYLELVHREKQTPSLHAISPISKGTFLCEYVGEIVPQDTSPQPSHSLMLTERLLIDASRMGNLTRFTRHSASPNCCFQKWWIDGLPRMCMFTSRAVKTGDELTYNHSNPLFDGNSPKRSRFSGRKSDQPIKLEELTEEEKSIVRDTAVFLQRNLRRIKAKRLCKQRDKQQLVEQPSLVFLAQNYYHPDGIDQEKAARHTGTLTHRDLFDLFYVHLRRSHFARTGRCSLELIDSTCSYAQLAQLTYVLNELFEAILNYKCYKSDVFPSNALKKCPLKRLFPMYYELISKPMDLTMIRQKLDAGEYLSYSSFEEDLLLLFANATSYCGEDSDVGRAVTELKIYFLRRLKVDHQAAIDLFTRPVVIQSDAPRWTELEDFITRLHEKEVFDGDVRQTLFRVIFTIDEMDLLEPDPSHHQRNNKPVPIKEHLVHCRCGSHFDETILVQCYACQLWQHASCIPLSDLTAPYFCFECNPTCQSDPSFCMKTHVCIPLNSSSMSITTDQPTSYSTLTRLDGFLLRINECYQVLKPEETSPSSSYDIFAVERLWIDQQGTGQVSGFFYRRPHETLPDANRKFFSQELLRYPSNQETLPISWVRRPCHVFDLATFCKGKPISESSSRLSSMDLFVCEYRVDKAGRTFTRLPKSKHGCVNTKSYCFDSYLEKLAIKREHRSDPKQQQQEEHRLPSRRRSHHHQHSLKFTAKQFDDKSTHIDGLIEKLYCRSHPSSSIPADTKLVLEQFLPPAAPLSSSRLRSREKNRSTTTTTGRRSRSDTLPDEQIISQLLADLLSSL